MIPLAIPDLTGNEAKYLQECIKTTFVSSVGPFVDRFEALAAVAAGSARATATSAGTTGLHVALTAVGVGCGDLVILPAYTFIASANAIAHCGARPWLLDIAAESWTLDPERLAEALAGRTRRDKAGRVIHIESGRRVAAIMPVYALGTPAHMDPIVALARDHGLPVIADAAAALGASYWGDAGGAGGKRPVGALGADLTVFSFNGNKTLTCGGGGAVAGDDADLVGRVRHLATTAKVGADYDHDAVGFNYRMTNLQAAVGCAQMERLEALVAAKRAIRARYDAAITAWPGVEPFPAPAWAESACWFSGALLPESFGARELTELIEGLRADGVAARPFWKPMHWQAPHRDAPAEPLPVSEAIAPRVLTLPCSTSLSEADQQQVIRALRRRLGAL